MNILYLTLISIDSIAKRGIYTDLMREYVKRGDEVYIVSPVEKKYGEATHVIEEQRAHILRVQTGNLFQVGLVEKGISQLRLDGQFYRAVTKYFKGVDFDVILYSTPPITLTGVIGKLKKKTGAQTYLMLKDIFPQNAVDLGMLKTSGVKGFVWRFMRSKEKKLYALSEKIGCMSKANVEYVLAHNPEVMASKVEVFPNCIEITDKRVQPEAAKEIRIKYGVPADKSVFVYGGNLGRPQDIPFVVKCIEACSDIEEAFFLIVGDGTEYDYLATYVKDNNPKNLKLIKRLPKDEYDTMIGACDVGLIFLDHRFTIPNYPSRLLAYMQAGLPVLSCTDKVTDVGRDAVEKGYGWWCESLETSAFVTLVKEILSDKTSLKTAGERSYECLGELYSVRVPVE